MTTAVEIELKELAAELVKQATARGATAADGDVIDSFRQSGAPSKDSIAQGKQTILAGTGVALGDRLPQA